MTIDNKNTVGVQRPKKSVKTPTEKALVTEQEIYDVFAFAKELYTGNFYPNVFTPQLVNQRLKDVTMNPLEASAANVERALKNPKGNEENLIGYSEFFELTNSMYKRSLKYLATLLSFDLDIECINANTVSDYKSKQYALDSAKVSEFLGRFDYKAEFSKIMMQLLRQETFYGAFRDDGDKYVFQELPRKYSLITGRFNSGMLFDFNMLWFIQPAVDINMYPPVFKEYFSRAFRNGVPKYIPSSPLNERDGSWVYWVQTGPEDGMWAFKFSPEIASNIPFLSATFNDVVLQPLMRQLQTNQNIAAATKVILGEIPFLKDSIRGSVQKDQLALAPQTLAKFMTLFKDGLSDVIKTGALPMQEIEPIEFKGDNDVYSSYNRNTAGLMGLNSSYIYSSDKKNAVETQIAMNVDENMVKHMYSWFADFMNFEINKRTKKFKFKFSFEGYNIYLDRNERTNNTIKMMQSGFVDMNKIAHIFNTDSYGLQKRLMATKAMGLEDLLTILPNANTQFGGDAVGRPSMTDTDLSESGSYTRDSGGNEGG